MDLGPTLLTDSHMEETHKTRTLISRSRVFTWLLFIVYVITTAYRSQNDNIVLLDRITMDINDILSDHPSASVGICGDFSIHHKEWLVQLNKNDEKKEILSCLSPSLSK